MPTPELVHVYTVNEPTEAELLKETLEVEGIPCAIEGENQGGFAGVLQIRLFVPAEHAVEAREFLLELESEHHDEEE